MTAGTSDQKKEMEAIMKNGLRANHCYSILSVHEVTAGNKKVRLLKLRNPWGKEEWTGAWSDHSMLWTDQLRNQVGSTVGEAGTFCINLEDYLANFSFTNICKYNDDDCHSYAFKNKPAPAQNFFEFELDN